MEKSLNEETYEKLKYDIMNFEVLPGDSISAQKIALRYNVSRTPAREAIVNLEKEGLLKVIPQSGTYVACINCKRSEQEWFVRKSLEIGMVDAIFKNASADMLDKMAELNNRLINYDEETESIPRICLLYTSYADKEQTIKLIDNNGCNVQLYIKVLENHIPNNNDCTKDSVCTICGKVFPAQTSHKYSDSWSKDDIYHWKVCENDGCEVTSTKTEHSGTDDGDCTTPAVSYTHLDVYKRQV